MHDGDAIDAYPHTRGVAVALSVAPAGDYPIHVYGVALDVAIDHNAVALADNDAVTTQAVAPLDAHPLHGHGDDAPTAASEQEQQGERGYGQRSP